MFAITQFYLQISSLWNMLFKMPEVITIAVNTFTVFQFIY